MAAGLVGGEGFSSEPIRRKEPTTSAETIAASLRWVPLDMD